MGVESNTSASYQMILNQIYPVGSIYESVNDNDPNEFIGGTWVRLGQGRMFIGADNSTYTLGGEGGESDHMLTGSEIPQHTHRVGLDAYNVRDGIWHESTAGLVYNTAVSHDHTVSTGTSGGSVPHENMPPYIVYYAWERIS